MWLVLLLLLACRRPLLLVRQPPLLRHQKLAQSAQHVAAAGYHVAGSVPHLGTLRWTQGGVGGVTVNRVLLSRCNRQQGVRLRACALPFDLTNCAERMPLERRLSTWQAAHLFGMEAARQRCALLRADLAVSLSCAKGAAGSSPLRASALRTCHLSMVDAAATLARTTSNRTLTSHLRHKHAVMAL